MFSPLKRQSSKELNKILTFDTVKQMVQDNIGEENIWGEETARERQQIIQDTLAGVSGARDKLIDIIEKIISEQQIEVQGQDVRSAAVNIYKQVWGLGAIEDLYYDPAIDEIQVNGPGPNCVKLVRKGVNMDADICFKDEREIQNIIRRLFMHDTAVGLDQSQTLAESMRKDGTRITAACPPTCSSWTFVLRKHDTFEMTPENLIKHQTLDAGLWDMIAMFARYGVNMLISGGMNTGKTHLLRRLVAENNRSRRIICIETDRELNLITHYPERNIVEFEEHENVGATMDRIFRHILRYSADILIVGEFRGHGEAREAINACTRGCEGSMATAHFSSVESALEGTAKMVLNEGVNLPLSIAKTMVATAFNVVIQMVASRDSGIKKIVRVTELIPYENEVKLNDLVVWRGSSEDYYKGDWETVNPPSDELITRMRRHGITESHLAHRGWL